MKKLTFAIICMFTGSLLSAQEGFKVGVHGAVPVGDNQDVVSLVAGLDLGYMHALGEMLDLGVAVGFINGFPEKYDQEPGAPDLPHVQFLPLAASLRFWPSNSVSIGGDVGTALGINEGNEGGFYYKPTIGYLMAAQTEVSLSYAAIQVEEAQWATINLGILYTFPPRWQRR